MLKPKNSSYLALKSNSLLSVWYGHSGNLILLNLLKVRLQECLRDPQWIYKRCDQTREIGRLFWKPQCLSLLLSLSCFILDIPILWEKMRDHQNHGYAPASRGKQCHRGQNNCGFWNLNSSPLGGNLIFFSSSLNNLENILLLLNFVMFLICFALLVFPLIRRILLPTDNCL